MLDAGEEAELPGDPGPAVNLQVRTEPDVDVVQAAPVLAVIDGTPDNDDDAPSGGH